MASLRRYRLLFLMMIIIYQWVCIYQGYFITLEPNNKVCYFIKLSNGNKMGINYEVDPLSGDKKTVDLEIYAPNGEELFAARGDPFGTYQFHAILEGRHHYCFSSTSALKLNFNMIDHRLLNEDKGKDPFIRELEQLDIGLKAIKDEQEYILLREQAHHRTADSTHSRVLYWGLLQYAYLVAVCGWQVYYVTKFFEVKRSL